MNFRKNFKTGRIDITIGKDDFCWCSGDWITDGHVIFNTRCPRYKMRFMHPVSALAFKNRQAFQQRDGKYSDDEQTVDNLSGAINNIVNMDFRNLPMTPATVSMLVLMDDDSLHPIHMRFILRKEGWATIDNKYAPLADLLDLETDNDPRYPIIIGRYAGEFVLRIMPCLSRYANPLECLADIK